MQGASIETLKGKLDKGISKVLFENVLKESVRLLIFMTKLDPFMVIVVTGYSVKLKL